MSILHLKRPLTLTGGITIVGKLSVSSQARPSLRSRQNTIAAQVRSNSGTDCRIDAHFSPGTSICLSTYHVRPVQNDFLAKVTFTSRHWLLICSDSRLTAWRGAEFTYDAIGTDLGLYHDDSSLASSQAPASILHVGESNLKTNKMDIQIVYLEIFSCYC